MARIRARAAAVASAAAVCLTVVACTGGGAATSAPHGINGCSGAPSAQVSAGPGTGTGAEQARTASAHCTSSSALIVGVKVDQYGTGWLDVRTTPTKALTSTWRVT